VNYKLLIETSNPADIALIKSLLDAEDILYFVQGEAFNTVRLLVEPVRFMVAADRLEEAEELIGAFRASYGSASSFQQEGGEATKDD
jgi:hypothetical protein